MKTSKRLRFLSMLLAVACVFSLCPALSLTTLAAVDDTEYATAATDTELDSVPEWFAGNDGQSTGAAFAKIVDGIVYTWGQNSGYVLGLPDKSAGEIVSAPEAIPMKYFGEEKVKFVRLAYNTGAAVTEGNNVYVWGARTNYYDDLAASRPTPTLITSSSVIEADIEIFNFAGPMLYLKDINDTWYVAGGTPSYGQALTLGETSYTVETTTGTTTITYRNIRKLTDEIMATIENKEIKNMVGCSFFRTYIVTADGMLYGFGRDNGRDHHMGLDNDTTTATNYTTTPANLSVGTALEGKKVEHIVAEDQGVAVVDSLGDVYVWGQSNYLRFGDPNGTGGDYKVNGKAPYVGMPYKIYNHTSHGGQKAARAYISCYLLVILCKDNSLYAQGNNANGLIIANDDEVVDTLTPIAKNISINYTIVGVAPNNNSLMILSKAGDMFFMGDNTTGASGSGSTEQVAAGSTVEVVPSTMPPSEPLTANKITFEIELENGDSYLPNPSSSNPEQMIHTYTDPDSGLRVQETVAGLEIDAGTKFKLSVYFEDFGKLHTFTVPIRFDPEVLQVVNDKGVAYVNTTSSAVTVANSTLDGSGITQHFTNLTWVGGKLAVGADTNTYPKIHNTDGWVSVLGETKNAYASIEGRQKMFSVTFMAMKEDTTTISFAYSNDGGAGYDQGINSPVGNNSGPYWSVFNASSESLISSFAFEQPAFPTFFADEEELTSLELELYYGSGIAVSPYTKDTTLDSDARAINWSNKDIIYTVQAMPNPTYASFPQVDWTYSLKTPDGRDLTDYISILEETTSYLKFQINPNATFGEDSTSDDWGTVFFEAYNETYDRSDTMYVVIKSFDAPPQIHIAEAWEGDVKVTEEFIFNYTDDRENKTFNVDYGEDTTGNKEVIWKLLDENRNEIDLTDPDVLEKAKVTFAGGINAQNESATINTHYSTPGDTYVILHVESLFDSAKYDEVKIKVHLLATDLGFNTESNIIRMAINDEKDLSSYLLVSPADVYQTNLVWSIESLPSTDRKPGNFGEDDTELDVYTYASIRKSVVTSYQWSTPDFVSVDDPEEYVTIRVTDTLSNSSATVDIDILAIDALLSIDDIVTYNRTGTSRDIVQILAPEKLQEGDVVEFYASYDAADPTNTFGPLEAGQVINPTFLVSAADDSSMPALFAGGGGEIAVRVIRTLEGGGEMPSDRIPVTYTAEPSLVHGYARLLGKSTTSEANKGIRIDLVGLQHQETVYTGADGYFKFNDYIPPGTYTLIISKQNYLTRYIEEDTQLGYTGLVIPTVEEFIISDYENPIYIYPGELTGDHTIDDRDVTYYISHWLGQYNPDIPNFDAYDFLEGGEAAISAEDLMLILMRDSWVRKDYPQWTVPVQ